MAVLAGLSVLVSGCSLRPSHQNTNRDAAFVRPPAQSTNPHLALGTPACQGTTLTDAHLVICYDEQGKIPHWVAHRLTVSDLKGTTRRAKRFVADPELSAAASATNKDYARSGFDRGHLAPAADFVRSREAMRSTFRLSNIAPQNRYLNRGVWREIEEAVRDQVEVGQTAWVFTGTLQGAENLDIPASIGNGVRVPRGFYKVYVVEDGRGKRVAYAFVVDNIRPPSGDRSLSAYQTSVDRLEERAGLDFFSALEDGEEFRLEAQILPVEAVRTQD